MGMDGVAEAMDGVRVRWDLGEGWGFCSNWNHDGSLEGVGFGSIVDSWTGDGLMGLVLLNFCEGAYGC